VGPLLEWGDDHAEPLGRPCDVRDRISSLFPSLVWEERPDGSFAAQSTSISSPREVSVHASSNDQVQFVVAYASPPVLRKIMATLQLNYCCAPESGEMRDPFSVGPDWLIQP
jgi:hypothetical protein